VLCTVKSLIRALKLWAKLASHARGPATANAPFPSDEGSVAGTTRADDDADRSRRRDVTSATGNRLNDIL